MADTGRIAFHDIASAGVEAFNALEFGAQALLGLSKSALETAAAIRAAATGSESGLTAPPLPAFAAFDEAATRVGAALRDLGEIGKKLEQQRKV